MHFSAFHYFQFSTCYCCDTIITSVIVSGVIFPWKSASFFIQCGLLGYMAESELPVLIIGNRVLNRTPRSSSCVYSVHKINVPPISDLQYQIGIWGTVKLTFYIVHVSNRNGPHSMHAGQEVR